MNTTQFHDHHQPQLQQQQRHAKKESNNNNTNICPPPLKVGKDSHLIKKSSSSSSSAASSLGIIGTVKPTQQRHPVIIYTHSPKVIHTHPKDFMALVQKLTGLSRNEDHHQNQNNINHHRAPHLQQKTENVNGGGGDGGASSAAEEDGKRMVTMNIDDNESSSVITDENCEGQVNSCFVPAPLFDPPAGPFLTNIPVFTPNTTNFLSVNYHQPYYHYTDSLFLHQI